MTTIPDCITEKHLRWAASQGCSIQEGTAGFGRPCVGLQRSNHWVDYSGIDWRDPLAGPDDRTNSYHGFIPEHAYHKDDVVCVLTEEGAGSVEAAWRELALWLDAIIAEGWVVNDVEHQPQHALDLILHGTSTPRLARP